MFGELLVYYTIKLGLTGIILYYTADPRHMKEFEKAFLEKYGAKTHEIVKLTLDETDIDLLSKVCGQKAKKRQLVAKPPAKEIDYVGFKNEVHHPFRAEVIRCNEEYAMIGGLEPHCIFVLRKPLPYEFPYHMWVVKTKIPEVLDSTLFHFNEKFCHRPPGEETAEAASLPAPLSMQIKKYLR